MWELLLQLRVLLPYLTAWCRCSIEAFKALPDLSELTKGIAAMQTSSRIWKCRPGIRLCSWNELNSKWARLRVVHENSIEESRRLLRIAIAPPLDACHGHRDGRASSGYGGDGGFPVMHP